MKNEKSVLNFAYVLVAQTTPDGPFYTEKIFDTYSAIKNYVAKKKFSAFTIEKAQYIKK